MTTGLTGILNASFELIKRLEAMGHEVIAASPASVEEKVAMQGLNYLQLSPVNFDPAPAIPSYSGKLRKVKRFWYKLRCAGKRRKAAVAALGMEQFLEKVADVAPDLVIIDIELHERIMALYTANYKVLLLSQWFSTWDSKGLPPIQSAIMPGRGFAGSSLGLRLAWTKVRITRWYTFLKKKFLTVYTDRRSILQLYAKESGFPTRLIKKNYWPGPFSYAELPVISMTAKDLDFEHEVRPGLTYVGPMVSAQRKEAVNDQESEQQLQVIFKKKENEGKKLIYCSVSTFSQADTSFLKKVTQAFSGMSDWLLIISLGGKATTDSLGEVSENVFVFSRVPQLQVLARADLSINHGGIHTINECLHFGVPMLIYSGKRSDQNGCAARVNYHGVGLMADKDRDRPEDIKRKINELLHATDVSVRLDELMGSNKNRQVDLESVLNGLKIKPSCINTP